MNDPQRGETHEHRKPSIIRARPSDKAAVPLTRPLFVAAALLLASVLAACSHAPTSSGPRTVGDEIAAIAQKMEGVPYVYGGNTPAGFDCSGLVHFAYGHAGISVPRNSQAQFATATRINQEQAKPGDLLFFVNDAKWHVAIYVGKDEFIHAPAPGWKVSTASLKDDYYREKLVGVGRLAHH
jgi:murein DD-endopeptidase